jgi:hypothetical protein
MGSNRISGEGLPWQTPTVKPIFVAPQKRGEIQAHFQTNPDFAIVVLTLLPLNQESVQASDGPNLAPRVAHKSSRAHSDPE